MLIKDIIETLEAIAPPHLQESYDNAGLIVGSPETLITGVLFCLDSTESIVNEAIEKKCNLIVAHHPIVFRGLKRFNAANYVERTVMLAIKNDIAIYAIHTNLDNVYHQGVNGKIAEKLGLVDTQILAPKAGQTTIGSGMVGYLPFPREPLAFLHTVKSVFKVGGLRHTTIVRDSIKKVAVCGGSGSFLLGDAIRAGADVFLTADFKYHEFFDADGNIIIVDIGHFESEQYTIELLFWIIREKFRNFALHCTDLNTNPVHYL